jgi:ABC-type bacteriocin/lantibiotic exporter with double-glycine peptidase domain
VPACLRMALSAFGVELSEEKLREICDCTPAFGTSALEAVKAARRLGFAASAKYTLTFAELKALVEGERYPIAFIDMLPISGIRQAHAVLVSSINETTITVYDPEYGERTLSIQSFNAAWAIRHNLVILIER